MANLYELTGAYVDLLERLENSGMDEQTVIDTLEGSTELMSVEEKASNICKLVKNAESDLVGIDLEIKRLTDKKKFANNAIDRVKKLLKDNMEIMGIEDIKIGTFNIKIQKNPGALKINDGLNIPGEFLDVIPERVEPNKAKIKEAIKNGREIEGCEIVHGTRLVIK